MEAKLSNSGRVQLYKTSFKNQETFSIQVKGNKLVTTSGIVNEKLSVNVATFKTKKQALKAGMSILKTKRKNQFRFKGEETSLLRILPDDLQCHVWKSVFCECVKEIKETISHEISVEKGFWVSFDNTIEFTTISHSFLRFLSPQKQFKQVIYKCPHNKLYYKSNIPPSSYSGFTRKAWPFDIFELSSKFINIDYFREILPIIFLDLCLEDKIQFLAENGVTSRTRYGFKRKSHKELAKLYLKI